MEPELNTKALQENLQDLQDLVIQQASRLINDNLYTKSLLSFLPVALLSTDKNGMIQVANQAAEEMLQTTLQEIKGSTFIDLFTHSPALVEQIELASNKQAPVSADSIELILANGQKKVVNIHIRLFYDEERRTFGTLLALEDQTYITFLRDSFKQHALTPPEGEIVAQSPKIKQAVKQLEKLATSQSPVLFSGSQGSGKTFFAAKLHNMLEGGEQDPLILVDCGEIGDSKFKETLFGSAEKLKDNNQFIRFKSLHDYGTVHLAENGTLVLINIDTLSLEDLEAIDDYLCQVEDGSSVLPKCRIVATTQIDVSTLGNKEDLRKPIFDRIFQDHVNVPELNKRRKDILPLARLFLAGQGVEGSKQFTRGAENALLSKQYNQSNVKELRDAVELAVLVADGDTIRSEHIFTGPLEQATDLELDLTDIAPVKLLIGDKSLSLLRSAVLAFFVSLIVLTLAFPERISGIVGNDLVWGAWWVFLVFGFLLLGRVWCTVCPLSTAGRLVNRIWSLAKAPPGFVKKSSPFLIPVGFVGIIWVEQFFHMTINPRPTGFLLITLIVLAVLFAVFFERETWCRYLCPLGNFGGIFSLSATLFVRSTPNVCATKCTTHNCNKGSDEYPGCPVFHHPLFAKNAHICKLCFTCLKSCPHGSARLYLRPPLIRIWQQLDIEETISYFALVFFFISPFLLASDRIPQFAGPLALTTATLSSLLFAAICRYTLPKLLFGNDENSLLSTTRFTLVLLLLAWGPFAAFQFGHIAGLDTLVVTSLSPQNLLNTLFPSQGLPLLALVQLCAIWFGALISAVTLLGLCWKDRSKQSVVSGQSSHLFFGFILAYALLSSWIVI